MVNQVHFPESSLTKFTNDNELLEGGPYFPPIKQADGCLPTREHPKPNFYVILPQPMRQHVCLDFVLFPHHLRTRRLQLVF